MSKPEWRSTVHTGGLPAVGSQSFADRRTEVRTASVDEGGPGQGVTGQAEERGGQCGRAV